MLINIGDGPLRMDVNKKKSLTILTYHCEVENGPVFNHLLK